MTDDTDQPTEPVEAPDDHRLKLRSGPGSGWFAGLTSVDVNGLAFDNFAFDGAVAPEYPSPAVVAFVSDAHRTVSLLGGIAEEVEMLRKHTDELFEMTLPCSRRCQPCCNLTEIDTDGKDIARYIHGIGDKCSFYVASPFERREPPAGRIGVHHTETLSGYRYSLQLCLECR